jgi:hypothetical protein
VTSETIVGIIIGMAATVLATIVSVRATRRAAERHYGRASEDLLLEAAQLRAESIRMRVLVDKVVAGLHNARVIDANADPDGNVTGINIIVPVELPEIRLSPEAARVASDESPGYQATQQRRRRRRAKPPDLEDAPDQPPNHPVRRD